MKIVVNGRPRTIEPKTTIAELLQMEGYGLQWVGVWVNDRQLLQKEYSTYTISEGDEIKIIRPLGGG
ncbi:MAG: sulfur carrier protein ThiS [Tissierellia bacterium]|nr:sulfur carrier protein ThiS [Tissierellia bacterium]